MALTAASRFWFAVLVVGQWIFIVYLIRFYGGNALHGDFNAWNKIFPSAHVPGAAVHNTMVALHLALAVAIMACGQLQLVPGVRARAPALHRWTGRFYALAVVVSCLVGLQMVWLREQNTGDVFQQLGISLDAVLTIVFAALAVHYAIARDIKTHRRWALRLFLGASGVWFFRVGLMAWIMINQAPVGFDPKTFRGPFLTILSFASYLLPLALLELYLRARERGPAAKSAMAAGLVVATLVMGVGIAGAAMMMWLPRM
jgi:uncharacterized membrane protein